MEKKTRLKLKMIFSLCTCLLSLFSLVAITLSWFAMNKNSGAGGIDVVVKNDSLISGCEFYIADSTASGSEYLFISADSDDKNMLGMYDVLNDKYQFLIKVKLASSVSVKVTAETETDYFLGSVTEKHPLTSDGTGNVLSSVVSFSVFGQSDIEKTDSGYKLGALPSDTVCFFDRSALSAATKPEPTITLTESITASADENGDRYFFVMLSYDPDLASAVMTANLGNEAFETAEQLPFVLDFTISVTEA